VCAADARSVIAKFLFSRGKIIRTCILHCVLQLYDTVICTHTHLRWFVSGLGLIFVYFFTSFEKYASFFVMVIFCVFYVGCRYQCNWFIDFQNGGRSPSWNCFTVIRDHPRSRCCWPQLPVKFHVSVIHRSEDIGLAIWIFCIFGLKCLFKPPKWGFWRTLDP